MNLDVLPSSKHVVSVCNLQQSAMVVVLFVTWFVPLMLRLSGFDRKIANAKAMSVAAGRLIVD